MSNEQWKRLKMIPTGVCEMTLRKKPEREGSLSKAIGRKV
jgi:hypothetical protein